MESPAIVPAASTSAAAADMLLLVSLAISAVLTGLVFGTMIWFAVKYRRRAEDERGAPNRDNRKVEIAWIIGALAIDVVLFVIGTHVFLNETSPPADALPIYVVGQQWMWKIEHPSGRRQIDELVVPAGRPVKLIMTSQDVIHSFYVPAFRMKMDLYPGRFTYMWFEARKQGTYHLLCAEYCGTDHSRMRGTVRVVGGAEYDAWAAAGAAPSMAERGHTLFAQLGCASCHGDADGPRGPALAGVYGRDVELQDGARVRADETYLRESVLSPAAHVARGEYASAMPSYRGQIGDSDVNELVAYLKELRR